MHSLGGILSGRFTSLTLKYSYLFKTKANRAVLWVEIDQLLLVDGIFGHKFL